MVKPNELNYDLVEAPIPKVKMMPVFQNEGGQNVQLQVGNGPRSTFYSTFPAIYFDKSYLQFRFTPPVSGATKYNWIYADGIPFITQFRAYFKSTGTDFMNITNFHKYTNLSFRRNTPIKELKSKDKLFAYGSGTVGGGQFEGISANNCLPTATSGAVKRHDNTTVYTPIDEPLYMASGTVNVADPVIDVCIRFDTIKDTILEYNKLFFTGGQEIVFEIYWGGLSQIGFTGVSATDPSSTPLTISVPGAANTISNLRLMIATETDIEILSWAAHKYQNDGFVYKFKNVVASKATSSQSTQQQIDTRLTAGQGVRLLKVHWGCYNGTEQNNLIYDHSNVLGAKISQYATYLNDQALVNGNYTIALNGVYVADDYNKDKKRIEGSSILSRNEYYYNWCATVDFSLERSAYGHSTEKIMETLPDENIIQGIHLGPFETKVSFIAQSANEIFNHYLFAITERELRISPTVVLLR